MRASIPREHPLRRWFTGLVENAMYAEVGVCDPTLVDYLSELLTEFIHTDRICAIRDPRGRPIDQIAEMLMEVDRARPSRTATRVRAVHRHIGDYTLFWTGIYPENLRRLRGRNRKDHLIDYCEQGKRSYARASELSAESMRPPASLLRRLSDQFEFCVHGLGIVRAHVRTCMTIDANHRIAGIPHGE